MTFWLIEHKNVSNGESVHEVAIALVSFEGRVTLEAPMCSLHFPRSASARLRRIKSSGTWEEQGTYTVLRGWSDAYSSRRVIKILPLAPRLDILPAFPCRMHRADTAVDACQISNQDADVTLLSLESTITIHRFSWFPNA